jgi:membrane protease YdiL (CAAX protease family)
MTLSVGALSAYAIASEPELRREKLKARDLLLGLGSAGALYGIFRVGDVVARRIMPRGAEDINSIYELRKGAPPLGIAAALASVIGPGEEIFWHGFVQRNLQRRFGVLPAWLMTSSVYGLIHLVSENLTLTGAATTAGLFWGAMFARERRIAPTVVSHIAWDIWIFLIAPTQ